MSLTEFFHCKQFVTWFEDCNVYRVRIWDLSKARCSVGRLLGFDSPYMLPVELHGFSSKRTSGSAPILQEVSSFRRHSGLETGCDKVTQRTTFLINRAWSLPNVASLLNRLLVGWEQEWHTQCPHKSSWWEAGFSWLATRKREIELEYEPYDTLKACYPEQLLQNPFFMYLLDLPKIGVIPIIFSKTHVSTRKYHTWRFS